MPPVSLRRLAIATIATAAFVGLAAVVSADGLSDGVLRSLTSSSGDDDTVALADPPSFSKQVNPAPDRTIAPATTGEATAAGSSGAASNLKPTDAQAPRPTAAPTAEAPAVGAPAPVAETPVAAPSGLKCVVRLHGKGGGGGATHSIGNGIVEVAPGGNASAWGGRAWVYFPESGYAAARSSITSAVDAAGCGQIILDGFSNGGSFAAKLYCRGETFGGRLVGVVVDDPVVDHAVEGCAPARGVRVALYWTGALASTATPGWNCANEDWTCEGGTTIGIDAYQGALGVTHKQSANSAHAWYTSPPELSSWW